MESESRETEPHAATSPPGPRLSPLAAGPAAAQGSPRGSSTSSCLERGRRLQTQSCWAQLVRLSLVSRAGHRGCPTRHLLLRCWSFGRSEALRAHTPLPGPGPCSPRHAAAARVLVPPHLCPLCSPPLQPRTQPAAGSSPPHPLHCPTLGSPIAGSNSSFAWPARRLRDLPRSHFPFPAAPAPPSQEVRL